MKCSNGTEPDFAHFFEAAQLQSIDIKLVLYCRLCGEVRTYSDRLDQDETPLDDLPYSSWRNNPTIERRES